MKIKEQEEEQKAINMLVEIIYEMYLEDLKSGKINIIKPV